MTKKKISVGKIIGIVLLLAIVGSIIFLLYCVSLAFQDNYSDKYALGEIDDTLVESTFKAALFGSEFELSDAQINTAFNEAYCSEKTENENGLEKIHIYFHPNNNTEIYAKLRFSGYDFGFYSKAEIFADDSSNFTVILHDAKLGELSLSDGLLSWALGQIFNGNDLITAKGTSLSIKASTDFNIGDCTINLSLKKFEPQDGFVSCQTNSLTDEALRIIGEYCTSNEGRQKLKDIFGFDFDDVKKRIFDLF